MSSSHHHLTYRPRFDAAWKDLCIACILKICVIIRLCISNCMSVYSIVRFKRSTKVGGRESPCVRPSLQRKTDNT